MSSDGVWLGPVRPRGLLSAPASPLLLLLQFGQPTPQAGPGPGFLRGRNAPGSEGRGRAPSPALCRAWCSFGRRGAGLRVVNARGVCDLRPLVADQPLLTAPPPPTVAIPACHRRRRGWGPARLSVAALSPCRGSLPNRHQEPAAPTMCLPETGLLRPRSSQSGSGLSGTLGDSAPSLP